jgi:hypothetical protein
MRQLMKRKCQSHPIQFELDTYYTNTFEYTVQVIDRSAIIGIKAIINKTIITP